MHLIMITSLLQESLQLATFYLCFILMVAVFIIVVCLWIGNIRSNSVLDHAASCWSIETSTNSPRGLEFFIFLICTATF